MVLMCLFTDQLKAQAYRMEIGLAGGGSFYMGDANQDVLFKQMEQSLSLLYRYNLNGRFSVKANAGFSGVSGSTTGMTTSFPAGQDLQFDRKLVDAGVQMEMNFYEYGMPDYVPGSSFITPYISLGVGIVGFETTKIKASPFIPIGVGLKIKVLKRLNLGCEWSFHKTYTDDLDYSDYGGDFQLSDPLLVESARNKNKDWYSTLTINISIDMFGTGSKCYR